MSKMFIIILAAIAVIVLAVGIPNFIRARQTSASNVYVNDMRQIDAAKQQWALENSKTTNDTPTWAELLPYISPGFTNFYVTNGVIVRPAGGTFTIGRVGESPSCVVDGKRLVYP
ncbi:MAG TPA: hypothetical protein VMD27_03535 [Candidatus Aquilonibacter sp.]|nr:hypothetical protein [Candidatus Aquilonibacter sp.]